MPWPPHSRLASGCPGQPVRDYEVVVNDCAAPPVPGIVHIRTRATPHGKPNFTFNYDKVVDGLPAPLKSREQDWLDVMGSLFAV